MNNSATNYRKLAFKYAIEIERLREENLTLRQTIGLMKEALESLDQRAAMGGNQKEVGDE